MAILFCLISVLFSFLSSVPESQVTLRQWQNVSPTWEKQRQDKIHKVATYHADRGTEDKTDFPVASSSSCAHPSCCSVSAHMGQWYPWPRTLDEAKPAPRRYVNGLLTALMRKPFLVSSIHDIWSLAASINPCRAK